MGSAKALGLWKYEAVGFIAKAGADVREVASGQLKEMLHGPLKNPQMCPKTES